MAIAMKNIKEYYMERIDKKNFSVIENVERYLSLLKLYRKIQAQLNKDELVATTVNHGQKFIKPHPLISELKNINAQLINLKKEIDRHVKEHERYRIKEESHPEISNSDLLE